MCVLRRQDAIHLTARLRLRILRPASRLAPGESVQSATSAMNIPKTSAPAPAPITAVQLDAAALGRLRELDPDGSHGVLARVLTAYQNSLLRHLGQLQDQRTVADAQVVAAVAHTLKSSSASVGALAFAAACSEVEARLRAGQFASVRDDVEHLMAHGQAALAAVEAMLQV